jgi:hypothetical protein
MEFKESQKFRQTWLWIVLIILGIVIIGGLGTGFCRQIILGQKFGTNPMSDKGIAAVFLLVLLIYILIFLLFIFARLNTVINDKGIQYRFFPFHTIYHMIIWDDIIKFEVITYNPIRDYGGWGLRIGKKGKAYNVAGNMGLLIYLKSGKTLLIGTQKDKELSDFISKIK